MCITLDASVLSFQAFFRFDMFGLNFEIGSTARHSMLISQCSIAVIVTLLFRLCCVAPLRRIVGAVVGNALSILMCVFASLLSASIIADVTHFAQGKIVAASVLCSVACYLAEVMSRRSPR